MTRNYNVFVALLLSIIMYKRFTLDELKTVQNVFIPNFFSILKKEKCMVASDLFKKLFKDGDDIYYLNRGEFLFRFAKKDDEIMLMDEKEKIQIVLDENGKREFNGIIKNYLLKKEKQNGQKSIETILLDEFNLGKYGDILGKKYIVYDIETTANVSDIRELKFLIAYSMQVNENGKMTYEYIDQEGLPEFVKKLLDFDGYVVGFNSIGFDNIVSVLNVGGSQDDINKLNAKSIDLFLFVHALTGKRLSLNKIGEALVGISKTLESGLEGEKLYNKYIQTGEEKYLEEFKQYCKNDVRMTALILIYLMHFKKLFIEGEEIEFDIQDLIKKSKLEIKEDIIDIRGKGMFE
ncbi:MAG: ribonuclease H-like domain-containing protein [Candidatus Absconditabacterales bacterium]